MESIDALAKAVNEYDGGMVLVSHDMRLISQVAKEIWICDNKSIEKYRGDILNFKMDMRAQMGIEGESTGSSKLRGDASVKAGEKPKTEPKKKAPEPKLEVIKPKPKPVVATIEEAPAPTPTPVATKSASADDATASTVSSGTTASGGSRYIPPHLRKKMAQQQGS